MVKTIYLGWSVHASIALSMNLRVLPFLQPHPSAFYQNRGGKTALLLLQLLIAALRLHNVLSVGATKQTMVSYEYLNIVEHNILYGHIEV